MTIPERIKTEVRRPRFWLLFVAASWIAVLVIAFRPGIMSGDTFDMLEQGLAGAYTNQHPPLLSWGIGRCVGIFGTPIPLFLLQLVVLSGAMIALMRKAGAVSIAVLLLFLWLPSTWATGIAIWKDVATAGTLLLAVVAIREGRGGIATVLLIAATVMRHNAIFASVPLLIPALGQIGWIRARGVGLRVVATVVAIGIAAIAPKLVDRAFGAKDVFTLAWVLGYDVAGVYVERPELFEGSLLSEQVSIDDVRANHNPESSAYLFVWPQDGTRVVDMAPLIDRRDELKRDWWRVVREAPAELALVKWRRFVNLMGAHSRGVHNPFHNQLDGNRFGFRMIKRTMLHQAMVFARDSTAHSPLFRGWVWVGLAVAVTVVAFRLRAREPIAVWIGLSGLAYAFGYLLVAPASDFRYLFWTLVSVFATVAVLLPGRGIRSGGA